EQSTGSEQILIAMRMITDITNTVRDASLEMRNSSTAIIDEMNRLLAGSATMHTKMDHIIDNTDKINKAVRFLEGIIKKTMLSVMELAEDISQFKVIRQNTLDAPKIPGKRILVVEDIEINRAIIVEILDETQAIVEEAQNGKEALDKFTAAASNYYNLILMDVQMPQMDGIEATRRIRALKRGDAKSIPIIAVSIQSEERDIEAALAAGMNQHIAKPVDPNRLFTVLRGYFSS
ncbi:response regulator, partial [Breznakiellaceae bacterium SP9]